MGFTLGGKAAKELGMMLLQDSKIPILPDTRDRSLIIPGRHGSLNFDSDLGPRYFELPCALIYSTTATELQEAVRALAAHLINEYGRPKTMPLIFDREPNVYYNVCYYGSLPIERLIRASVGSFSLPLVSHDPFAYDIEETVFDQSVSSTIATVAGSGNITSEPVIEITALETTTNPELTIGLTSIKYQGVLTTGDTLTLDVAKYQATIDGANVLNDILDAAPRGWPVLYPGDNGVFFSSDDAESAQVKITHKGRWA